MHSVGKILSKCGYNLDCHQLEDYEVEALCLIESTYNELEAMDLKRSKK